MEFKDIVKECGTCECFSTRKDHMPCAKCLLNKAYISHWKVHPTIAHAFGEKIEHQKPVIFHTNKKKIEEAVEKANAKIASDAFVPTNQIYDELRKDLGFTEVPWTDPLRNPVTNDETKGMKGEDDGVSEETENQEV